MLLKCQSCENEWDYQGESKYYATCPNCHYKVKISEEGDQPKKEEYNISVLGGTGDLGEGIVKRAAAAGYKVIVGSRKYEKAQRLAEEYREGLESSGINGFTVDGDVNQKAAEKSEIVIVTIPYKYASSTVESMDLDEKIVVSTIVPMKKEGDYFKYTPPEEGSAAEELQSNCNGKVVSAFQNVPAKLIADLENEFNCDVIVCGDDEEAKEKVKEFVNDLSGLRSLDGGPLSHSSMVESETVKLLNLSLENPMKHVYVVYKGE